MKLLEKLDLIWDKAKPCKCGNDNNWEQDVTGSIYCDSCKTIVVE